MQTWTHFRVYKPTLVLPVMLCSTTPPKHKMAIGKFWKFLENRVVILRFDFYLILNWIILLNGESFVQFDLFVFENLGHLKKFSQILWGLAEYTHVEKLHGYMRTPAGQTSHDFSAFRPDVFLSAVRGRWELSNPWKVSVVKTLDCQVTWPSSTNGVVLGDSPPVNQTYRHDDLMTAEVCV